MDSMLLSVMFPESAIVPTSHPYKEVEMEALSGHNASWWQPYQVTRAEQSHGRIFTRRFNGSSRVRELLEILQRY